MSPASLPALVDVLRKTSDYLRERGVPSPTYDAELLLGHVLDLPRLQIYLQHERPLTAAELDALRPLVRRRGQREPVAWVIGEVGFRHLTLEVRPGVLVPRPDTETLVEAARSCFDPGDAPLFVADVGCGTGAVGLALAMEEPRVRVYATDVSPVALEVTRANVARLGLGARVAVLSGSLLTPIPPARPVDWVVSNPPYIPTRDLDGLEPEVSRYEPRLALDGGRDGLEVVHALTRAARDRARRGLLLEIGHDQADATASLLTEAGFVSVRTWKDLAGVRRVVGGLQPGA